MAPRAIVLFEIWIYHDFLGSYNVNATASHDFGSVRNEYTLLIHLLLFASASLPSRHETARICPMYIH
jgi:hypothetical protein